MGTGETIIFGVALYFVGASTAVVAIVKLAIVPLLFGERSEVLEDLVQEVEEFLDRYTAWN